MSYRGLCPLPSLALGLCSGHVLGDLLRDALQHVGPRHHGVHVVGEHVPAVLQQPGQHLVIQVSYIFL